MPKAASSRVRRASKAAALERRPAGTLDWGPCNISFRCFAACTVGGMLPPSFCESISSAVKCTEPLLE